MFTLKYNFVYVKFKSKIIPILLVISICFNKVAAQENCKWKMILGHLA